MSANAIAVSATPISGPMSAPAPSSGGGDMFAVLVDMVANETSAEPAAVSAAIPVKVKAKSETAGPSVKPANDAQQADDGAADVTTTDAAAAEMAGAAAVVVAPPPAPVAVPQPASAPAPNLAIELSASPADETVTVEALPAPRAESPKVAAAPIETPPEAPAQPGAPVAAQAQTAQGAIARALRAEPDSKAVVTGRIDASTPAATPPVQAPAPGAAAPLPQDAATQAEVASEPPPAIMAAAAPSPLGKPAAKSPTQETKSGQLAADGPDGEPAPLSASAPRSFQVAAANGGLMTGEDAASDDAPGASQGEPAEAAVDEAPQTPASPTPASATPASGGASAPPAVLGAGTISHLAAQMQRRIEARATRFDIQLDPHGLGQVNVQVQIDARGRLSAALAFERPESAEAMKGRAGELKLALEQAGFDLSGRGLSFETDLDRRSAGGFMTGQDQGAQGRGRAFGAAARAAERADQDAAPVRASRSARGLDIRI